MIAPKTITDPKALSKYHEEHLSKGDYYDQDKQTTGEWVGEGSRALGLSGAVSREDFANLSAGLHPTSGQTLTSRMKDSRRAAYDFTISPPKSVSVLGLVGGDGRVIEAHKEAIREASKELERHAAVRVRSANDPLNGKDRITGNMTAAVFHHDTSRSVAKGVAPDPHLHSHVVVFNATQDNGQWKALQNFEMLRSQKLVEAVYYHSLSQKLHSLGYATERTKDGFKVDGISDELSDKFSKRHFAIQEKTKELKEQGALRNEKALAEAVAHDKRVRKDPTISTEQLHKEWNGQLTEQEKTQLAHVQEEARKGPRPIEEVRAGKAIDAAESHVFERNAVAHESDLLRFAVENVRGSKVSFDKLRSELAGRNYIREEHSRRMTTKEALEREQIITDMVREGREKFAPLASSFVPSERLNPSQRDATTTILNSKDFVTVFRGGAGTGKSFTLQEIRQHLVNNGHEVQVLAPQSKQVEDLKKDGFSNAGTVAGYLQQSNSKYKQVLIVDEAGQIGGDDMKALLTKAKERGNRVILSGDTRQHGAVAAADALIAIERHGQTTTAVLPAREDTIQRQQPAWYRQAVAQADAQRPSDSFQTLEKNGAVVDVSIKERIPEVAKMASDKIADGKSCLVVSQTNHEVSQLNEKIRSDLKSKGVLSSKEWTVTASRPVDLTNAQKLQAHHYNDKSEIVVNRGSKGVATGARLQFDRVENGALIAKDKNGNTHQFSGKELNKISVNEKTPLQVSKGDQLLIRSNLSSGETRIPNGSVVTVDRVDEKGDLHAKMSNGKEIAIAQDKLVAQRGYASTSYSAQGKTVDHVMVSDSQCKAATNAKEYYVSISRGRESVSIFTSDREALKDHVGRLGDRALASELKQQQKTHHQDINVARNAVDATRKEKSRDQGLEMG